MTSLAAVPDCDHDWAEHSSQGHCRLPVRICRGCGEIDWHALDFAAAAAFEKWARLPYPPPKRQPKEAS